MGWLLALWACAPSVIDPDTVAIALIRNEGGSIGTAVIHAHGPGGQPSLQWHRNWVAWSPEQAFTLLQQGDTWEVSPADERGRPTGEVVDSFTGDPVHVAPSGLWVQDEETTWRRGFDGRITDAAVPRSRSYWQSRGGRTSITLTRGRLTVQPANQPPAMLLDRVEEVVGLWFVREAPGPGFAQRVTVLQADGGKDSEVDGDLSEWQSTEALAVQDDDQVLVGHQHWEGPADGSFGVAARLHNRQLVLAIRVRDDQLTADDQLVVLLPGRHYTIPLLGGEDPPEMPVERREVRYGVAIELGLGLGRLHPSRLAMPLVVRLIDVDEGEDRTVLATSPDGRLVGVYPEPGDASVADGEPSLTLVAEAPSPTTFGEAIAVVQLQPGAAPVLAEWLEGSRRLEPTFRAALAVSELVPPLFQGQPVPGTVVVALQVPAPE